MSTPIKNAAATAAVPAAISVPASPGAHATTAHDTTAHVKNVIRKEDAIIDLQRTTLPRTRSYKHGYTLENIMEDPYIFQSEQERKEFESRTI